jgi:hypothetical protein
MNYGMQLAQTERAEFKLSSLFSSRQEKIWHAAPLYRKLLTCVPIRIGIAEWTVAAKTSASSQLALPQLRFRVEV